MASDRLRKQISFSPHEQDIYDYLDKCKNASALVKKLVKEHIIIERLKNQGAIDKDAFIVDFDYNKSNFQTKANNKDLNDDNEILKNTETKTNTDDIHINTNTDTKEELDDMDKKNKNLINNLPF